VEAEQAGFSRELRVGRAGRGGGGADRLYSRRPVPEPSSRDDLGSSWEDVRAALRRDLPAQTFELWLEPLRAEALHGGELVVSAPRSTLAWVERRYGPRVTALARELIAGAERLAFVQRGEAAGSSGADGAIAHESIPVERAHTFDRFVIGPGNRMAHAAALAVAELPGEAYNPLFLHGPPGLGKSHLLGAIVNYFHARRPDLTVHYTTAERFTTEFVTALRQQGPERFKERYRNVDALLIDDVQVIEGKPRTEEEFVHTFNALHGAGKQIVLSSDRPPHAHAQLAERLRDRFAWGLTVEIAEPDLRTRLALLWRMVAERPIDIGEPRALATLAASMPTNVRRLEGAMTRVAALGSLLSEPLTDSLVGRALARPEAIGRDTRPRPTIEAVQEAVAASFGIRREELLSTARTARIARARQVAIYLSRELVGASSPVLGRAFRRDHSTVLHAIRAVETHNEPGSELAAAIHTAREALGLPERRQSAIPSPGVDPQGPSTAESSEARRRAAIPPHQSTT
jgi:chromosomal replication initiator protein